MKVRLLYAFDRLAYPFSFGGGAERATHRLLLELARRKNVEVQVFCAQGDNRRPDFSDHQGTVKFIGGGDGELDVYCGYPVRMVRDRYLGRLKKMIDQFQPTVVVTHLEGAYPTLALARARGIPGIWYLHDVEPAMSPTRQVRLAARHGTRFVCCSPFVQRTAQARFGVVPTVVYPLVDVSEYRVRRPRPGRVTLINPAVPKGKETFLKIAALLPDEKFLVVEGWQLGAQKPGLLRRLKRLPQIEFLPTQSDMREVYRRTGLLLVPSIWEEAFCRVAIEAQASGIPVVASRRGGLSDLGQGVVLIDDYLNPEAWVAAIRTLRADRSRYARLAAEAKANAERIDYQVGRNASRFLSVVRQAMHSAKESSPALTQISG